jgi:branched-chain amino acid transport system ATP-binding protein
MKEGVMLQVKRLSKSFGGLTAINELDMDVFDSEILGVIGPNGAGKTTLFNAISGFSPPTSGQIVFNGQDITRLKAHEIARLGISRTFQTCTLFMELSALENTLLGYHMNYKISKWKRVFHTPSAVREREIARQKARSLLEFMGVKSQENELACNLPHGHQRILGICIALATNPKLLMVDEPMTGMNQTEVRLMVEIIRRIRDIGVTIVIVEHNMKAVMNLCDRLVVLNFGQKIAEGPPKEIQANREVTQAYLGTGAA